MALGALIAAALGIFSPSTAGVPEGKRIFEEKDCASCHQMSGPVKSETIRDVLGKKGPELWYAGSKFRAGFLREWLASPEPIRPMKYYSLAEKNPGDHPRLSPADAAQVADYLMSLTSPAVKDAGITPRPHPLGRRTFVKELACYGCHQVSVRGRLMGGLTGPRLAGSAERLDPDWIYAYLTNPDEFKPVRDMPDYREFADEREMKALAAYVSSLIRVDGGR